jgi:hypothetical protein
VAAVSHVDVFVE